MCWFKTDSRIKFISLRQVSALVCLATLLTGFQALSQTYRMDLVDGDTIRTCTGLFYDSGGPLSSPAGNYGNNENYTVTFCSDNGLNMGLDFSVFEVRAGDTLFIYDGPSTASSLIGAYTGEGLSFQVAATDTAITLNFRSNGAFNRAGWVAGIECGLCIPPLTSPILPADNEVCAGETVNYSVDDHPGSTYTWTTLYGTPASLVDGSAINVTWSITGSVTGSVKVLEENSCGAKDSSILIVDIYDLPVVSFSGLASDYCEDDGPVALTGNPSGGTFSGPGIAGNIFDPVAAGLGTHAITYTITSAEGCTNSDIQNTTVHPLPVVSSTGLNPLYDLSDAPATLSGSPTGGTFSGNGIAGISFNPAAAGVGIHRIIYSYSDPFGCAGADTQYTEVRDYNFRAGAIVLSDIDNWCSADGAYSTIGATGDQLRGTCWANGPNYNRWFTFQATTNYITVDLKTGGDEGTMQYPFLAIWDGSNNQLGCASYTGQYSDIQASVTGMTIGTWYYISVDNYVGAGYRGTFTLCVDNNVSNDFKVGAIEITNTNNWCSGDAAYTTLNGTPDGVRPGCWPNGPNNNVWFKFQAVTTGITVDLKTGGSEGTLQYPFVALWDETGSLLSCARYVSQYSDLTIGTNSLVPGQWYYVSVDNFSGAGYRGTFKLCFANVVDYDYKAGAIELTDLNNWCSPEAAYTTINASSDGNRGSCWNTGPNFTRWFRFQATTTEILVELKTGGDEGTLQYPYITLLDTNNNELACARYSGQYSDLSVGSSSLTPGEWYYILVDNYNDIGYRGTFTLCVSDDIDYNFKAGAIELTDLSNWCSADGAYTTMNASPDGIRGSCWNTGPTFDRWFRFRATTNEALIQLKTGGSEGTIQYPYIALWDAMNVEVACARYYAQYSDLTIGASNLTPGQWYYITVDNYADPAYRGTFTLCISDNIDYNFKAGAIELTDLNNWCSADAAYTTINASADGTRGSCWNTGPNFNRWFSFVATTNEALIQLKTGGSEGTLQYPYIALWDSLGSEKACARYFGQYSDLTIGSADLIPGDRYYITVDNYADVAYRGTFTLCISDDIDYNFKEGAIVLSDLNYWCSPDAAYTTLNASSDGPRASCWNTGSNFDRWFVFQATTNEVTIDLKTGGAEGTIQYPYIALWDTLNNEIACARYATQYGDLRIGAVNLIPGEWYYITVDNYADVAYRGTFTLCINDQIDYDFKAGAHEITSYANYCSADAEFTTIDATADGIRGSCWNTGPNNNRWFTFQATGPNVTIWLKTGGTEGTLQYPYIALWDAADVQLACARYSVQYSDLELVYTSLTPGSRYYITVDNFTGAGYRGTFTLCMDDEISYDFVAGAIELSDLNGWCSAYSAYSTVNATADQARGSCWPNGPNYNRWFKFQAPTSNVAIQIRTTGVEGNLVRPYVALWDALLGEISCKSYYSDNGDIEIASTGLTPGQWYYISIDNFNNIAYRGTFTLCITSAHPNDNMANAIEITDLNGWCSEAAQYSNIIATADQSQGSCWAGAVNKNVWFKFRATSVNVTINVRTGANEGEMRNQQVALWTAAGVQVGCNALVGSGTLTLTANTLAVGNWYYISVDDNAQSGTFTLCVDDDIVYPFPAGAVELTDISDWCSPDAVYTNVPQPNDTKSGSCWQGTPYKNKWFKFQATTSQVNIQVKTGGVYGSMQRQQVAIFNSTGAQVSCAVYVYNQGTVIIQSNALTAGQWYWFAVDDNMTSGTFSLCVDDRVDYDYRSSAVQLTDVNNWCSGDAIYSNLFATNDGNQGSCWSGAVNKNVWFSFTAANPFIKISVRTGGVYGNMERQQIALWNAAGVQVACARWVYNQGTVTLQTDTLKTGNIYYISVDDDLTSGSFSLCADDNISNDYKAGATLLTDLDSWCSSDAAYSNLFATNDQNMGSCWSGAVNKNVWFTFQANTSFIKVQVRTGNVYGNMERQQVALWNAAGVQVACARWVYNQGTVSLQTDTLTDGDWYWISVDDDLTSGTFSLCVDENIDYDYRAGAVELTNLNNWCSSDAQYSNLFATNDQNMGSCWSGAVNKNVWFKFQANTSFIEVRVRTGSVYGNMERQQLAVWNEAGVQVGCAKWVYNQGTISFQTDTLTIGHIYYISVDDDLISGTFSLCVDENIDYDYRAGAIELTDFNNWCSADAQYSNLFATDDQSMGSCWSGGVNKNVWFTFQAESRFIKVRLRTGSVYGNMERQQLSLWNEAGVEVACARWVFNQGTVTLESDSLTVGHQYYISVDDDLTSGSFSLCIDKNPDYDYLEGAVVLSNLNNWCSSDAQYSNLMATDDRDMAGCWTGSVNKNVWFTFQATGSFIRIVIKTGTVYGSMQRQQVALWNSAGVEVACARWIANQGNITMQIDTLTTGNWYWISVDDDNVSGTFSLCIDRNPDYDYKAGAVVLNNLNNWCSSDAQYSNLDATADQNMGSCWGGAINKNVWFTFQAINPHFQFRIRTGSVYGSMRRQQAALWNAAGVELACGVSATPAGDMTISIDTLTQGNWYWISVDDNNTSGSFTLCVVGNPLYVDATGTNVTCFGYNNGTALATAGGGIPPYTYLWSGPGAFSSTLPAISGLVPGLYTVIARDATAKTATDQIIITQPSAISIVTDLITNVSCSGIPEGSIEITPSGGTTPYSYSWTGPGVYSSNNQDIFNLLEGNYSLLLTDANGCTFNYNATINILDIIPPIAICRNLTVQLNSAGTATITPLQIDNGSNDACGIDTMFLNDYSFTCADIGNNVVVLTVRDNNGNTNTCSSTVTVQDTVKPVALCRDITVQLNVAGIATIIPTDVDNGSSDECGIALMTLDQTVFTCTEVGPNTVTLTVTDNNGNTNFCQSIVTVEDNIAPAALCNDITIQLDASGNASISPSDIDAGSTDACGIALLQVDKTGFTCSDVGPNPVLLTVTDNNGNISTCTANVTIEDNIPPSALCKNITVQLDAAGNASILPADINNGSSDACGILGMSLDITDFTCADLGPKLVILTVTDVNGNVNTCNSIVTVGDTISPTTSCPADKVEYVDASCNFSIPDYTGEGTANDNCGSVIVTQTPAAGTVITGQGTVQIITLTADDGNGNAVQCTFNVTLNDTISPTISCPADKMEYVDGSCNFSIPDYTGEAVANDNCGSVMVTQSPVVGTVITGQGTVQIIILTADDGNGNTAQCTFNVTLNDTISPTISCPADKIEYVDGSCNFSIPDYTGEAAANDNCGSMTVTQSPVAGTVIIGQGTVQIITLTANDGNGNTSQCTFNVTLNDTISPIISCPADKVEYVDGSCNFSVPDYTGEATGNDNCGSVTVTQSPASGTIITGQGTAQLITLTADDGNGNTAQCTFSVTLGDTISPTISCPADKIEYVDGSCNFSIPDYAGEAAANDNCGSVIVAQSPVAGTIITGQGTVHVITLTTDDGNGKTAQCTFSVTLSDTISPTISCPADKIEYVDASCNFSMPDYTAEATANDNCGSVTVIQSPVAGTILSGDGTVQTVTLTADDGYGNTSQCTFDVTLNDTVSLTISCPGDKTEYVDAGCNFTLPDYTVEASGHGNCSAVTISQVPVAGTVISMNATTQTITLTADDGFGNTAQCEFIVTLSDTVSPVISCPTDKTEYVDAGCSFTIPDYTVEAIAADNCGSVTVSQSPLAGTIITGHGTVHQIALMADDSNGNTSQCVFNLTLIDTLLPAITCPSDMIMSTDPGECSLTVTGIDPMATDNCGVGSIDYTLAGASIGSGMDDASGEIFNEGLTTVTYRVYDEAGNKDSCSFNITVTVTSVPPDTAYSDRDSVCAGDGNVILSYSGGVMPEGGESRWYTEPSFTNNIGSGNDLIIAAPLLTSTYYIRFEGNCDTTSGKAVTVNIIDQSVVPDFALSDIDTVCPGDGTIILMYSGGNPASGAVARWYSDPLFTQPAGSGNNLSLPAPLVTTAYYVRFEGACDTTAAVMTTVYVYTKPQPKFLILSDRLCPGAGPVLYVADGFIGSLYNWTVTGGTIIYKNNDSVLVDWGNVAGDYQVTVIETTSGGCLSDPVTLDVQVTVPAIYLGSDRIICEGETTIITPAGSFASLIWFDGSTGATYTADKTELISITVFDDNSCPASDSVQVTVMETPVIYLGKDTLLCGAQSLVLDAGYPGSVYEWSTGETSQSITINAGLKDVWVIVTSAYGCLGGDTIHIYRCSVKDYFSKIPNAFTPNEDNVNDTWYFDESAAFPDIIIEIFDRWGNLVFRSERGYPDPWDGRNMSGKELPMDSYYYIIDPGDGSDQIEGTVTIIR